MNNFVSPTALVILDGWGHSEDTEYNAIYQAQPETFNYLWKHYPHALLKASGTAVGLPDGFMGNSEVGHMTIGAGRIIKQPLTIMNESITDKTFFKNSILIKQFHQLKKSGKTLHLIGLLSDGGVHSHEKHLHALIKAATENGISDIVVHAFLDGRDTPPQSAKQYLKKLETLLQKTNAQLGSISGRFYAMDRDKNWDRTEQVFEMLLGKTEKSAQNWQNILEKNYAKKITDEFISPTLLNKDASIKNGDGIVLFNFRPDRMRQLTSLFLQNKFIKTKFTISMTRYDKNFKNPVLLETTDIKNTLLDKLEAANKTIFTIAETEKYAHVTYFLNGGHEIQRPNETRVLVPSQPEKSYVQNPEMSAAKITEHVLDSLKNDPKDFYIINYANADMVGHSGDLQGTIKAVKFLDKQLKQLYQAFVEKHNGILFVTADHGNAEQMMDTKTQTPKTSHTTNPVPFIIIQNKLKNTKKTLPLKKLAAITPFIIAHNL